VVGEREMRIKSNTNITNSGIGGEGLKVKEDELLDRLLDMAVWALTFQRAESLAF